jgi:hypothetical protein
MNPTADRDPYRYSWRGPVANDELNNLHAEGFGHRIADDDWQTQLTQHSLGWVTARDDAGRLAGFVNVAWDGGVHAFLRLRPHQRRSHRPASCG